MPRRRPHYIGGGPLTPVIPGPRTFRQLQSAGIPAEDLPNNCLLCVEANHPVPNTIDLTMTGWSWLAPATDSSSDASIHLHASGQPSAYLNGVYDCTASYEFRSNDIAGLNTTFSMTRVNQTVPSLGGRTDCWWMAFDIDDVNVTYHRGQGTACAPDYTEGTTVAETTWTRGTTAVNTGTPGGCGSASQSDYNDFTVGIAKGFDMFLDILPVTESGGAYTPDANNGTPHWRLTASWMVARFHKHVANTLLGSGTAQYGRATYAGIGASNPGGGGQGIIRHGGAYDSSDTTSSASSVPPYRYTPNSNTAGDWLQIISSLSFYKELACTDVTDPSFTLTRSTGTVEENRRTEWDVTAPATITLAVTS